MVLGAETGNDNGFSAYLPDSVTEDAVAGLLVETNGRYYYAPSESMK